MTADRNRIRELLAQPGESLNVEIKRWLDPDQAIGAAKIIKAVFGLRNRNGGALGWRRGNPDGSVMSST